MNQELTDLITRIENAGPEYIAFRKEVLGSLWNDHERAELLGPFALHRIDADEVDDARNIFGEADIVLYDPTTGEGICIKPPTRAWQNTLDEFIDDYIEHINQLPAQIAELYKEAIKEIKGYLINRYDGISPKKSRFIEWFVGRLPTPIFYVTLIRDAEIKTRTHYKIAVRQAPKVYLTPESVERSLHEYCQWKKGQQDKIYSEVTGSVTNQTTILLKEDSSLTDEEKLDAIINEFKGRNVEDNPINDVPMDKVINYFMQLTEDRVRGQGSFLTKLQFVHFLQRTFDDDNSVEKALANYTEKVDKTAIIKLFYNFFSQSKGYRRSDKKGKLITRDTYIKLLSNNVESFDFTIVKGNFNKSKEFEYEWKELISGRF